MKKPRKTDRAKDPSEDLAVPEKTVRLFLGLALGLTFLAYVGTVRFAFVYDDVTQIVRNPFLDSWRHVPQYFTQHVWSHIWPDQPGIYYRPVFLVWLLLNRTVFGLEPAGWHLAALAAHLLCTWLVMRLALRLTGDRMTAAYAALIFGLHPVHVEGVAWISGATEPLMSALAVGSVLCWLRSREEDAAARRKWQAGSLALFVLSALVKETGLTVAALVAAHAFVNPKAEAAGRGERAVQALRAALPFLALAVTYLIVRRAVLGGVVQPEWPGPVTVLLTLPAVLMFYARQLVWPVGLSAFYDLRLVTAAGWQSFWIPLGMVAGAGAALAFWASRSRAAALGVGWLMIPLLPALAGVALFEPSELVHDRYLYLPVAGFAVLLAMGVKRLPPGGAELFGLPATQVAAVVVLALAFGASTARESAHWASNLLLFTRGVEAAPNNVLAHDNLANEMYKRGRPDVAIHLYLRALELDPKHWTSHFALGLTYLDVGQFAEADRHMEMASAIRPGNANQYYFQGLARMRAGRWQQAEAPLRKAVELWPQGQGYHYLLGMALLENGRREEARAQFEMELKMYPGSPARERLAEMERAAGENLPNPPADKRTK